MDRCPACGTPYKSSRSMFCANCGERRPTVERNTCTNPGCDNHDRPLGQDEHYCDLCGSPTTLGEMIDSMT